MYVFVISSDYSGYQCVCAPGWVGLNCDQNVDECQDETLCRNGGACLDLPGNYTCICGPGWTGRNCEEDIIECTSGTCLNSGVCVEALGLGYTCQCNPGKTTVIILYYSTGETSDIIPVTIPLYQCVVTWGP